MINNLQVVQRLLLFVCCLSVIPVSAQQVVDPLIALAHARSFGSVQDIGNEKPLKEALSEMEMRYNINISYDPTIVRGKNVGAKIDFDHPLEQNLQKLLEEQGLRFKKLDDGYYVVLTNKPKKRSVKKLGPGEETPFNPSALHRLNAELGDISIVQDNIIKGNVTDDEGEPLPGVSVLVKGTSQGTITDSYGNYTLSLPSNATTLVFSFVGFRTIEVQINNRPVIDIALETDILALEEVVVVGYGEQKKVNITGAVSTISTDLLEERPAANTANLLAGLAPGLTATQAAGGIAGGDDPVIRLRGVGTLNNADPLILVDGTPASITDINPSDIENISILKDAAAAAIYGSRAANGVILVTTKRAKEGLSVEYQGFFGWQEVGTRPDLITDPILWMELKNEGLTNAGNAPQFVDNVIEDYRAGLGTDPLRYPSTDWFDELVGDPATITSHTFTFNGGNENSRIRSSINYLNQDGIGLNNEMERYSIRINQENKIGDNITVGLNLFGAFSNITPAVDGGRGDFLLMGMAESPLMPTIQAPDGRWGGAQVDAGSEVENWFALASVTEDNLERTRFQGQLYAGWDIIEGLRLDARVAINYNHNQRDQFVGLVPTGTLWNFNDETGSPTDRGESAFSTSNRNSLITNFQTLTYTKTVNEIHNFSVLVGQQLDQFRDERLRADIREFPSNGTTAINAGQENPGVSGRPEEWSLLSYFGRFNYSFKDKYLLEANVRYDGSSRFSDGNKWGTFPSFSAGWRISEESFFQDVTLVDELKFRGSWGELGNQEIDAYPYQAVYSVNESYSFGGTVSTGIAQTDLANRDIQWETTTTWNVGFDLAMLEGRIALSADYFNRETDGILVQQEIPLYLGGKDAPFENLAVVVNDGFEFDLSHINQIGEWTYQVGMNYTRQENELTAYLDDIPFFEVDNNVSIVLQEGYPINSLFGYRQIGIFQSQEEIDSYEATYTDDIGTPSPGDFIYADLNGRDEEGNLTGEPDGMIDDADRTVIGNQIPKHLFGANLSVGYKGFDLSIILQGIFDVDTWTGVSPAFWPNDKDDRGQIHERWLGRWTADNPSTELPRIVSSGAYNGNVQANSFFVEDHSFLRMKNLTFGYNFSNNILERLKVDRLRVYMSADNLLTFSKFQDTWGWDPERESGQFDVRIPNVRTIVFGANITF